MPEPFVLRELGRCLECGSAHDLTIQPARSGWLAVYDQNTLRYPEEHVGEPRLPLIRINATRTEEGDGPIMVARRKAYFSKKEVADIWKRTKGLCHLCRRKRWRLGQRSRHGWHIDHVHPNIGGLAGTELPDNFLVACAKCNLRKGRGYRHGEIRACLTRFMEGWSY